MSKKLLVIGIITLLVVAFLVWLFKASSQPLLGTKQTDLGRKHVAVGSLKNSPGDLPTSGDHYVDWVRAGVYEAPKDDGNLIHSMEHGYVIMHYNCKKQVTGYPSTWFGAGRVQGTVYAHGIEEEESSPSAESSPSGTLSEDCHKLVDQLIAVYEKKGKRKLIIVPRPQMNTKIALTAWSYIDKLDSFDEKRIESFIDAYRNQGPERTAE